MSEDAILSKEHQAALNQFRSAVSDILKPDHDDDFLLRWLVARNFDVKTAEKMIRKSFKFLYNIEAVDILNSGYKLPEVMEKYMPTRLWGFDKEGSPIRLFVGGKMDWGGYYRSLTMCDHIKMLAYMVQLDLKKARENYTGPGKCCQKVIHIIDHDGFRLQGMFDKIVFMKSSQLQLSYHNNFPELLKTAYVINVPSFFYKAIAMFKPFINDRIWKKFKIFSTDGWQEELLSHIDPKIVPKYYGGELDDPYHDPNTFIPEKIKIPVSYYVKDELVLNPTDPGITEIVIPQHQTFDHSVNVQKIGTVLKWIFQTKDCNIKYGVFFQKSQNSENEGARTELIKSELIDSHYFPERGELFCETAGEYILHFDNTYSWLTKKRLLLRVDVEVPAN